MAQSFWSRRKNEIQSASGYVSATSSASKPVAILMTILGILVVGGLLFGVFSGTKWAITKLTEDETTQIASNDSNSSTTTSSENQTNSGPTQSTPTPTQPTPSINPQSVTATSSTSTTTPSIGAKTVPNTGPHENYLAVFASIALISYFIYRSRLIQKD